MEDGGRIVDPLVLYVGFGLRDSLVAVPQTMAWVASVTYLLIHMFWQANLRASNETDLKVCRDIQDEMLASCGLVKPDKPRHWYRFFGRAWAHVTYVIVTALLLVGVNVMNASFVKRRMTLSSDLTSRVQILAENEGIEPAVVIDRCLADDHSD